MLENYNQKGPVKSSANIPTRNRKYWNTSNLTPKDPVVFNFCSEADIKKAVDKTDRKIARKKKEAEKENQNIEV